MKYTRYSLLIVCAIIFTISCSKKSIPSPEKPDLHKSLELLSTNNRAVEAGTFMSDSVRVRVVDENNALVPGIEVSFEQITSHDGSVIFPAIDSTDEGGYASAAYLVDTLIGVDTIKIIASDVDDSVVYLSILVTASNPERMELIGPTINPVTGIAGEFIADTIKVRVVDKYSNPVASQRVLFRALDRSIVVSDSTALLPVENDSIVTRTDASGIAWTTWRLTANPTPFIEYPTSSNLEIYRVLDMILTDKIELRGNGNDPGSYNYYSDIRPIFEDNCFPCHPGIRTDYSMNFYYTTVLPGIVEPGDSANSALLDSANRSHEANMINVVEEDLVIQWVVSDSAAPGSSGLNSYNSGMKDIFDLKCVSCHGALPYGNYSLDSFEGILGNGTDGIPNAIAGDSLSMLIQRILPVGNMRQYLAPDNILFSDSIINWIIIDSLRQY
ncbi:MAG: hypothetical protein V3V99_06225 [candidate division Zixibacteria bacterium]